MSALIRFHFRVDPDELDDEKFAKLWCDLKFALDFEDSRTGGKIKM